MATTKASASKKSQGKKTELAVSVTVAQFDTHRFDLLRDNETIDAFRPLVPGEYRPSGGTPLRDATARFVGVLDNLQADDRVTIGLLADASGSMSGNEESVQAGINEFVAGMADVEAVDKDAGGRVLCIVLTDGLENSSREVSPEALRAMIADRETRGWTFIYLGANQDAWNEGSSLGYSGTASGQSINYVASAAGTSSALRSVGADAKEFLADNVAYASARSASPMRSLSEDGEESLENTGAVAPRPNAWGGQPGMGDVGKGSRVSSYGSVDDALKAAKDATRK